MPATALGKITTAIAGTAGTGSLGVFGIGFYRVLSAHGVPGALWVIAAGMGVAAVLTGSLGLILEYRIRKLELQATTELKKARLDIHRTVVEKAAGEPGSAASYRELILADALYVSVEQNEVQLADKTHHHLYRPG